MGRGLRYVLFTQGCPHHCKGCHNPTTHPFDGGRMVSPDWVFADVRKNPIVRGVTSAAGNRSYRAESLRRWQSACALRGTI